MSNNILWLMFTPISQTNVLTKTTSILKPKLRQWSVKVDVDMSADEFKSKVPNPAFKVSVLYEYKAISIVTWFCLLCAVSI